MLAVPAERRAPTWHVEPRRRIGKASWAVIVHTFGEADDREPVVDCGVRRVSRGGTCRCRTGVRPQPGSPRVASTPASDRACWIAHGIDEDVSRQESKVLPVGSRGPSASVTDGGVAALGSSSRSTGTTSAGSHREAARRSPARTHPSVVGTQIATWHRRAPARTPRRQSTISSKGLRRVRDHELDPLVHPYAALAGRRHWTKLVTITPSAIWTSEEPAIDAPNEELLPHSQ